MANSRTRPGFLEQFQPDYQVRPYVYEDKAVRSLYFSCVAVQSSMSLADPYALELGYTKTMMGFLLFNADPRHILLVGLGGGSLSKYCYQRFPNARITTVEIDPEVIALRDEFLIPRDDERFRIIHADAAEYLASADVAADVILLDGFDATGLPDCLCSEAFYTDCWRALGENGVLVANLWSGNLGHMDYLNRLDAIFGNRVWCSRASDSCNQIAFAIKGENGFPHWYALKARGQTLDEQYRLDLSWVVRNLCKYTNQGDCLAESNQ
ncbi:MAG: fused MFS/spermidine synthase [Sulfuricella sp.]|nr:fused MFS/spermidine synthase [Sulfuricella sp.]